MADLGSPPQTARSDPGAARQIIKTFFTPGDKRIEGICPNRNSSESKTWQKFCGEVFQTVNRKINLTI
jgi:precorrin-2 methylase